MNEHPPCETSNEIAKPGRRNFFQWLSAGLAAIAGLVVALPLVGYVVSIRQRKAAWVSLGPAADFPEGETRLVTFDNPLRKPWDGMTAQTGVYVRRTIDEDRRDQFLVLAVNCAHLGCPVTWFPESALFMCPCHGGVYYADGERASGPPPRGLYACQWRVRGAQLELQAPHYPTLQNTLRHPAKNQII